MDLKIQALNAAEEALRTTNLSQKEFCTKYGFNFNTFTKWLRSKDISSPKHWEKLMGIIKPTRIQR